MALCVRKDLGQYKIQLWIRIFLIQCNFILSIVGKGGLTVSVMTKTGFFSDLILLDYYESLHFNIFLSCSAALIIIGWLGIFGGAKNCEKLIIANGMLLFGFEIGTTIYITVMSVFSDYTNTGKLYEHMREEMKNYNDHKDIIDTLQTTLSCCGLDDVTIWNTNNNIPISCCRNNQTETECKLGSPYLQTNGCFEELVHRARYYAWLLYTVLAFSGLLMNFGIALSYLQDRIINDNKKKKPVKKDSPKILRPEATRAGPSQEIEDKGKVEVDNKKGEDEDEKNKDKENNDIEKSEKNNDSEKDDNVEEAESNTCRNIYKDISNGRNVVTLRFY